jgi:HEPN domain-containing protein
MVASLPTPEQIEVAESLPKTHDLEYLIVLAAKHSIAMEPDLESASWLTPWAAEFRCDDAPIETLDRKRAIAVANAAVTWCHELLDEKRG